MHNLTLPWTPTSVTLKFQKLEQEGCFWGCCCVAIFRRKTSLLVVLVATPLSVMSQQMCPAKHVWSGKKVFQVLAREAQSLVNLHHFTAALLLFVCLSVCFSHIRRAERASWAPLCTVWESKTLMRRRYINLWNQCTGKPAEEFINHPNNKTYLVYLASFRR